MSFKTVIYPENRRDGRPSLIVDQLSQQQAVALAPKFLQLIVGAYHKQFEGTGKPLPDGVFEAMYGNRAAVKRWRQEVIPGVFRRGGGYSVAYVGDTIVGSLKTLPGDAIGPRRFRGKVGIAEVLVDPTRQRQGTGAALLHACFSNADNPKAGAMLDAFVGSSVNTWYRKLGFKPEQLSDPLELSKGDQEYVLPCQYYVSERRLTVAGIAERLESSHAVLRSTQITL
jgi:GNAT superfamily N-acetyltransferase